MPDAWPGAGRDDADLGQPERTPRSVQALPLRTARFPWLHRTLGVAGGASLLYVAIRTWRAARHEPTDEPARSGGCSAFASGALTNLKNPKSVVFFGSIFAAALPPDTSIAVRLGAVAVVALNALWWHLALGFVFSSSRAHRIYGSVEQMIDRAAAGIMGFFGILLLSEAR